MGVVPNAPRVQGNLLVLPRAAQLPPVCVQCGQPAGRYLPIKYAWLNPPLYLLIFLGLVGWIVMAVLTKSAQVQIPLCESHIGMRKQRTIAAIALLVACLPLGILIGNVIPGDAGVGWGMLVGLVLFFAGLVAVKLRNPLGATHIDDYTVTLRGVHSSILAQLGGPQSFSPTA